jgi:hypothetical protein
VSAVFGSERCLAALKWIMPHVVVAVQFDQVEGVEKDAVVSAVVTNEIERGNAVVITSDNFAILRLPRLLTGGGKFEQDPATRFIGILVAAVAEDHDAELPTWHHPHMG